MTDAQKEWLDRVKANFLYLAEYPMHEEIVKMVVLSPLLSLAGFYSYPFRPVAEQQVEIVVFVFSVVLTHQSRERFI